MTDEVATKGAQFTIQHVFEVMQQHAEWEALLYTHEMASMICEFWVARYGPEAAYGLMQDLADGVVERRKPGS